MSEEDNEERNVARKPKLRTQLAEAKKQKHTFSPPFVSHTRAWPMKQVIATKQRRSKNIDKSKIFFTKNDQQVHISFLF